MPKNTQVEKYEMLFPLLNSALIEMKEFSKKKQGELLNKLKVKILNKILFQVKELLSNENTVEFLELLDEDDLPSNSDAVLIIAQHKSAMIQFRDKYHKYDRSSGGQRWLIE